MKAGDTADLRVTLNDGREMKLAAAAEPPRPKVALLSKNAYLAQTAVPFPIHLNNHDELPQDSTVNFVLRSQLPASWARREKLEVATADDSSHVVLSTEDGRSDAAGRKYCDRDAEPAQELWPFDLWSSAFPARR